MIFIHNKMNMAFLLIISVFIIRQCVAEENLGPHPHQIPAAIDSYHQVRYIQVPPNKHAKEPQIYTVTTNSLPMKLLFRSTSSRLQIDQHDDHIPGTIRPMMSQNHLRYSAPPPPPPSPPQSSQIQQLPLNMIISPTIIPTTLLPSDPQQLIPLLPAGQLVQSQQPQQFLMPLNIYPLMMPIHNGGNSNYANSLSNANRPTTLNHLSGFLLPINHRSTNLFGGAVWNPIG